MKKFYLLIIVLIVNLTAAIAQAPGDLPGFQEDADDMGFMHVNNNVQFSVYPNPAINTVSVALGAFKGKKISVFIFDTNGRMVSNRQVEEGKESSKVNFNISKLSKGMYIIRVVNGPLLKTAKLFVGA